MFNSEAHETPRDAVQLVSAAAIGVGVSLAVLAALRRISGNKRTRKTQGGSSLGGITDAAQRQVPVDAAFQAGATTALHTIRLLSVAVEELLQQGNRGKLDSLFRGTQVSPPTNGRHQD